MCKEAIVYSTNGIYLINNETGQVLEDKTDHDFEIIMFDLNEFTTAYGGKLKEYDILDLGYWYNDTHSFEYEPPVQDHRELVASGMGSMIMPAEAGKLFMGG